MRAMRESMGEDRGAEEESVGFTVRFCLFFPAFFSGRNLEVLWVFFDPIMDGTEKECDANTDTKDKH